MSSKQIMIVTKTTGETLAKMVSVKVDDATVHHFHRYTKLPLPLSKHQFIDYYLDCLDPYTGCRTVFSQGIETHETRLYKLNSIVSHMNGYPSTQIFKNAKFAKEINFCKANPSLLSAFQTRQLYCYHSEIFHHLPTWEDLVLSFCGNKLIHTLKLSDRYHNTFNKVQAFRLVTLPKYDSFVKDYFQPSRGIDNEQILVSHCEFKCIE